MTTLIETSTQFAPIFDRLERQPPDALLALIGLHRADQRQHKIDVGVGVYRNESGFTPVMRAVKAAERRLVDEQPTKAYLGPEGDARFTELLEPIVFGGRSGLGERMTGVQTPGGTGALRLGAELIARAATSRVWIGVPTWPNHGPIFIEAGLQVETHAYFDTKTRDVDVDAMLAGLSSAEPGDIVLLHGCCHNPTGAGFTLEQWRAISSFLSQRGLVPFVDLAYQGLGDGLDADVEGLRILLSSVPEALVAYSCDKNFGLYRERVGALWAISASGRSAEAIRDNMLVLARSLWSMPPDHGAAIVRTILDDTDLTNDWMRELDEMRLRINDNRIALAAFHPRLEPIGRQRGMFAILPIDPTAVKALRDEQGIYMAGSGRINIAGLNTASLPRFTQALMPFL